MTPSHHHRIGGARATLQPIWQRRGIDSWSGQMEHGKSSSALASLQLRYHDLSAIPYYQGPSITHHSFAHKKLTCEIKLFLACIISVLPLWDAVGGDAKKSSSETPYLSANG